MESCSSCGETRDGACTCGAAEPFPLDVFAPDIAAPAPPAAIDAAASPASARPMLVTVAGARAHVVPKASSDELAVRVRSRSRIPTGIRLVIGRRRTPSRRSPEPPPASTRSVIARERVEPAPRERVALPEPERTAPPADAPAFVPPETAPPDPVGTLLGAMAAPSRSAPMVPRLPAPPPARVRPPVRADRVRVRVTPREPEGPGIFESAADAARRAASALSSAVASEHAALAAAAILGLALAVAAPSLTPAWLGLAALALAVRSRRAPTELAMRAAPLALAAAAAWTALVVASHHARLPHAMHLPLRPQALAPWACGAGLAASAAASMLHARRRAWPAAAALPVALLGIALLAPRSVAALPAVAAMLAVAAAAPLPRTLHDDRRIVSTTWAAAGAALALGCAGLAFAGPALGSRAAWLAWSAIPAGFAMVPAVAWAALPLARAYDDRDRRMARALVAAGMLALGCALVATASIALPTAAALAFLPLAAALPLALLRVRDRRHRPRMEAPWLLRDARIATAVAIVVASAALATSPGAALGTGVLLVSLTIACVVDPVLTSHPGARLVIPIAAIGACLALAAAMGLPLAWLPALGAAAILVAGAARAFVSASPSAADAGARLLLLGATVTLGASLLECASGAATAGLVGAALSALAPLSAWLPRGRRDESLLPALHGAIVAMTPAAPLLAMGAPQAIAPMLALLAWGAWLLSRERPRAMAVVGALCAATPVALLGAASSRGAGALPGALALTSWLALACTESALARRRPWRATQSIAAGLAVAALMALVAWASAPTGLASVALLTLAAALQAADRLSSDATAGRALRAGATVSWMAGAVLATLAAAADPAAGLVLAGAALAALLVAALRRTMAPVAWSGVAAALALAAACREVGIPVAQHPAVYVAPLATLMVGWGVLRSLRGAPSRGWLLAGLVLLSAAVLLEAHLPGAAPLLRVVAAALAATMIAGGVVARHRVPVLAGSLALAAEGAWLLAEGMTWVARHPLPGLSIVAAVAMAGATGLAHLAWRAGGRVPLLLAWTSDWARLREAWSRWS